MDYTNDELMYFNTKIEQRSAVLYKYLSIDDKNRCLLDEGCGEGYTLKFFRRQGWSVKGFDFSFAGVESKNPDCLDSLVTGDIFALLDSEIRDGKTYDVVWLQNVLEHVVNPLELLISLSSLVTPSGIAVVTVPNDYSVTQKELLELGHIDQPF